MQRLKSAITAFKLEFGVEPPSSISLAEDGDWSDDRHFDLPRSRDEFRKIFPDFQFGPTDFNRDGDTDDLFHLNGAECLVFFLGGMRDLESGVLDSFSSNPVAPFGSGGARYDTFYDFGTSGFDNKSGRWTGRLVDLDGDMFPELLDTIPGQTKPYLYFSTYGGRAYRSVARPPLHPDLPGKRAWHNPDNFRSSDPKNGMPHPYYRVFDPLSAAESDPYNKKGYQLISAGLDFEYGIGGRFLPDDPSTLSEADRDNIVDFYPGLLGD